MLKSAAENPEPGVPPFISIGDLGTSNPISVRVYAGADWPRIAPVWTKLAEISPHRSFYLSVEWVAAWMEVFGERLQAQILVFDEQGEEVGVCLLIRTVERHGPFRVSRIYLNTGGEPQSDRTFMEFNNILCLRGKEEGIAAALGTHLDRLSWDEFAIQGITPGAVLTSVQAKALPALPVAVTLRPTFQVDLDDLRRSSKLYLESVSANTRAQIRRSIR